MLVRHTITITKLKPSTGRFQLLVVVVVLLLLLEGRQITRGETEFVTKTMKTIPVSVHFVS
jgi:hypothetical protein